ncbi:hypothetical protein Q5752_003603 [Cryptotrichosporon argae]
MSSLLRDYIEVLSAEHVRVDRLRDMARNGIAARVRGQVYLYLLGLFPADTPALGRTIASARAAFDALDAALPPALASRLLGAALAHHTRRFENPTYADLISALTAEPAGAGPGTGTGTHARAHGSVSGAGGGGTVSTSTLRHLTSPRLAPRPPAPPPELALGASALPTTNPTAPAGPPGSSDVAPTTVSPALVAPRAPPAASGSSAGSFDALTTMHVAPPELDLTDGIDDGVPDPDVDGTDDPVLLRLRGFPAAPPRSLSRHAYLALVADVLGRHWHAEAARGHDDAHRRRRAGADGTEADWVYLVTPFACCLARPVAVFYGFQQLMRKLDAFPPLPSRLGTLLALFRQANPELHAYFEDEQVPLYAVAVSWLTTLLAREMWLGDVLRLWDAYIAADDMFSLHCYVCVAILETCKETLEELDGLEAKLMLLDLPPLNVDRLLQDAANLKVSFPLPGPVDG